MDIKHHERSGKGVFLIRNDEGKRVAEMTYAITGDSEFTVDHTEVNEQLRGKGVAKRLLEAAAEHARENNLKIHASCPFANRQLRSNPEYKDVFAG